MEAYLGRETVPVLAQHIPVPGGLASIIRDVHEQLLVGIALELWLGFELFNPCLLDNLRPGLRLALIQCGDCAEVDLLVNVVLQRGRQVISVVVSGAF